MMAFQGEEGSVRPRRPAILLQANAHDAIRVVMNRSAESAVLGGSSGGRFGGEATGSNHIIEN